MLALKFTLLFSCFTILVGSIDAQTIYKVCALLSNSDDCQALERDNSQVACIAVQDSVDCLLRLEEGRADFAILSAEEAIVAAMAQPDKYSVLAEVKNLDKKYIEPFAFQAVALVKADHTGGLQGLKGGGLCHPGYGRGKDKLWSDRVLKYFEKKVAMTSRNCVADSKSAAEDDSHDISRFFSAACRPGPWLLDPEEDAKLKAKFPSLCSLCTSDGSPDCDGYRYFEPRVVPGAPVNSHLSAVECVVSGKGSVAYVAYNHVIDYFKANPKDVDKYALLCEDGKISKLSDLPSKPECAWVKQPWSALVARKDVSESLLRDLQTWMPSGRSGDSGSWVDSLDSIIFPEKTDILEYVKVPPTITEYVQKGRPLPVPDAAACHKAIRWCTVGPAERSKCLWTQRVALAAGLEPALLCEGADSHVTCMGLIRDKRADFLSIDSNLGFLARKCSLSSLMYQETNRHEASRVIALIKEAQSGSITRFENLRDKNACFPEYGGIAWVSFIRAAHERKILSSKECDYASEVVGFFAAACAPGARDPTHFPSAGVNPVKLCEACRGFSPRGMNEQGIVSNDKPAECPADNSNKFYGTAGALRCLMEPDSNVAFLESQFLLHHLQSLNRSGMGQETFRILCRNGTLASRPGFQVDEACALSATIDGEIVARKDSPDRSSIRYFLKDLDSWFGYSSNSRLIHFLIFSSFNKTQDLLFKESTIGLARSNSENALVKNYKELFKHTEECTGTLVLNGAPEANIALSTLLAVAAVHSMLQMN